MFSLDWMQKDIETCSLVNDPIVHPVYQWPNSLYHLQVRGQEVCSGDTRQLTSSNSLYCPLPLFTVTCYAFGALLSMVASVT